MVNLWIGFRAVFQGTGQFNLLDRAEALLSIPVHFTGSAVMLFFVISGFCIHYPYAAGKRALQFKSYAVRRLLRIYPAYLVTVGFCLLVEALLQRAGAGGASPLTKVLSTAFMVQNYGAQAGQMVSNPALWSLPVEMELRVPFRPGTARARPHQFRPDRWPGRARGSHGHPPRRLRS